MVVVSKPKIQGGAIQVNIECARNLFAKNKSTELDALLHGGGGDDNKKK